MSDKQKYQLKKLTLEHELVEKATRLALIIGSVFLLLIAAWKLL